MSNLDKIELKILQDFCDSLILEYYFKMGVELSLARAFHFSNALLRFAAYYITKSKVKRLRLEVVKDGGVEAIETASTTGTK